MPIFEFFADDPTIYAMFFTDYVPDGMAKEMKNKLEQITALPEEEQHQQKLEMMKNYIADFVKYGIIDEETYNNVLKIVQKYNKGMTLEKLKSIIEKNKNLKDVMHDCEYNIYGLGEFEAIFPRSRLQALPEIAAYKKMPLEQKRNFDVKTYGQFASLPIFSQDDNTKRALVEFIAVMGLFETDADVEKRKQFAYKIATEQRYRFFSFGDAMFIYE